MVRLLVISVPIPLLTWPQRDLLRDTSLIPTFSSILSLAIFFIQALFTKRKQKERPEHLQQHIELHGGFIKFGLECLRLGLSGAILGINMRIFVSTIADVRISPSSL